MSRTTVKIGFLVVDNSAIARQFGASGGPDPMQGFKDLVGYLNAHGGLRGRRVAPEYFTIDGARDDAPTWAERACTFFSQDKHVALVVGREWTHPDFEACLGKARVPHFDVGIAYNLDGPAQKEFPYYSDVTTIGRDRYEHVRLHAALERGWLKSGDKIGVLIADCQPYDRVYDEIVTPEAKALGLELVPVRGKCNEGASDLAGETATGRSAVLQFKSQGVTTVMAVGPAESATWAFFTQEAEAQEFRPQYLVTSDGMPYGLATSTGSLSVPPAQKTKIRGFGWVPLVDTGPKTPPANAPQRAQRAQCLKMSRDAGGAYASGSDPGLLNWYFGECDTLLFVGDLLSATGGNAAMSALSQSYSRVAASFVSASAPAAQYQPPAGRRDGISSIHPLMYDSACGCIRYVGDWIHVP